MGQPRPALPAIVRSRLELLAAFDKHAENLDGVTNSGQGRASAVTSDAWLGLSRQAQLEALFLGLSGAAAAELPEPPSAKAPAEDFRAFGRSLRQAYSGLLGQAASTVAANFQQAQLAFRLADPRCQGARRSSGNPQPLAVTTQPVVRTCAAQGQRAG